MATEMNMNDEFVDYQEAADMMGYSKPHIYWLMKRFPGTLTKYESRGPYKGWLKREEVLRLIEMRRTPMIKKIDSDAGELA